MKLTIARAVLLRELQLLQEVIDKRITIPILEYALYETGAGRVVLLATNTRESLRVECEAEIHRAGQAVLPVNAIVSLLRNCADGLVVLDVGTDRVTITSDKAVSAFGTMSTEDFPMRPAVIPKVVRLPGGVLRSMIRQVRHAIGPDTRYWLVGAHIVIGDGRLVVEASDGHRCAKTERPLDDVTARAEALVPERALMCLEKTLAAEPAEALVELGIDECRFSCMAGARVVFAQLADGLFPDLKRLYPKESPFVMEVDREALSRALHRAMVVMTKTDKKAEFKLSAGEVQCGCQTSIGSVQERLAADYTGKPFSIFFDPYYVLDVLDAVESTGIRLSMRDEFSAAVWTPVGVDGQTFVVMPMRG